MMSFHQSLSMWQATHLPGGPLKLLQVLDSDLERRLAQGHCTTTTPSGHGKAHDTQHEYKAHDTQNESISHPPPTPIEVLVHSIGQGQVGEAP